MAQNNFFENEKYEQNIKNNKHQDVINYVGNPKRNEKGKYTELNFKKEDLEQALYSLKKDVPKIAEAFPNGFNNETLFVMKHQLDAYYNGLSDMTPQEVFSAKNILSLQNKPTVKALSEFAETKKFKAPLETLKITDENGQKTSEKRIGENIKDTDPDNLINLHKLRLVPLNEKGQHLKMKNEKNLISDTSAAAFQSEQKKVSKDIENALKEFGIKTPNRKPEDGVSKGNTVNQKEDRTFHEKFVALRNEAYAKLKMRVASLSNTSNYTNAESSKDSSTLSNNGDENLLNQVAEKINTVENKINAAENGTNNSEGVQSNTQETGQTQSDTSAAVTENSGSTNSSSSNSQKNSNSKNKDKGSKGKDNKDSKDKSSKDKTKNNNDKKNSSSETKQNNKSSENKSQKNKNSSEENTTQKDNAEKGNNKEQNSKAQDVKPMPVSENQGPQPQSQLQTQQQPQLSKGMEYVANEEKYQKKLDASRKEKERLEGRIKGVQARIGETMMEKSTPENEKKLENLRKEVNGLRTAHNKEVWNVSTYGATRDKFSREKHIYLTADESRALRQKEQQELDKIRVEKNQLITKMQNSSDKEEKKLNEKLKEVKKAENIKRERRNEYSR